MFEYRANGSRECTHLWMTGTSLTDFIVKTISVIVCQYFPVTGSLIWLNQGKPHHPTVEWMNQSQILLSPLSTFRNTLNRQLSVTFWIFVLQLNLTSIWASITLPMTVKCKQSRPEYIKYCAWSKPDRECRPWSVMKSYKVNNKKRMVKK